MTYKGFYGNSVLLGFLPEIDLCICNEYRPGSTYAGKNILEQIKYTYEFLLSLNKKLKYFRSDSAGFNSEAINYCYKKEILFSITADLDSSIREAIRTIPKKEFKPLYDKDRNWRGREYALLVHCINWTKEAFTLIVQRCKEKGQGYLFDEFRYRYYVIATNDFETAPEEIIHFQNQRGNFKNYNKELKTGFVLEYVPPQDFYANSLFFELGILAYNLSIALKYLVLRRDCIKRTISTLRWQIIFIFKNPLISSLSKLSKNSPFFLILLKNPF